jgi:glutaconate CoA-transferase subunit A
MSTDNLVKPYQQLRAETRARDRGLREKVMSLEDAANLVADGDHVALGGCMLARTPLASIWALIRARKRNLVFSRSIASNEGDLFYVSGISRHYVTSWLSQGFIWGVSRVMRHYTEKKLAVFEEWSHLAMGLRYRAGAMGVPFLPARTMLGSDVAALVKDRTREIDCPFTGERLILLPALNPDVALIHVHRCDAYGNAQIDGLPFLDIDIAMAAKRVILTTESIVSTDQIRRTPDLTRIPFFTVDAVVEAPFGSAPYECHGCYEPFFSHLDAYAAQVGKDPVAGVERYLEEYYYSPATWTDYVAKLGTPEILDAMRRGRSYNSD